jgi:hypothetical protein
MVAYTKLICERQTRLHFTHGEIVGDMSQFTVTNFRSGVTTVHRPSSEGGGHGGGDLNLVRTFVEAVRTRRQDLLGTDVTDVLKSHLTVFAAEHSRKTGTVVDLVLRTLLVVRGMGAFKTRQLAGSQTTQLYRGCTIYYIAIGK